RVKGQYDWLQYDQLINGLISRGITPYMILDYNNPVYGASHELDGTNTDAQIQGYTNFAKAAVARYKGKTIIWEIWNEPNLAIFWRPSPSASNYMKLIKSAVPAMRAADSNAVIVAPGVAFIANTFDYIKACAREGLFNYIDGVSVHPYKNDAPENGHIQYLYSALRDILRQYGKSDLPILGGEFGFSVTWSNIGNEQTQAEYLARQLILHDQLNIPVSIVYDFKNDGTDPNNAEHNFGTVRNDYSIKPAYTAIKTLRNELAGWNYSKKLSSNSTDYLFEYTNGTAKKVAAWTTGSAHNVTIYGKSVNLTKLPTYISPGTTPPPVEPPVNPPVTTTAPEIIKAKVAVKSKTGDYYAVLAWLDKSETEIGFDIYQSKDNTNNFKLANSLNALDGIREIKIMLKIGNLPEFGTYYYKIVAKYSDGSTETSNIKSVEVKEYLPIAPAKLTGFATKSTAQKNVVVLKWKDKSVNEDGFNVYYSDLETGPFEKVGTVNKNSKNVVHWLGKTGSFFYQLKSFNSAGESNSLMTIPVVIN
ncbi:MAG: cellulase family glycosylhydrolase, partial [Candidatus Aenigmarchaeota archaeon]|nr:cellulase family glycosylhydrolase [Candidatus Aenigmarchaeota archaeon]